MIWLYPRLSPQDALILWEKLKTKDISELKREAVTTHPSEIFAATSGMRVDQNALHKLASQVRGIATKFGYPESVGQLKTSSFDSEMAIWLYQNLPIYDGEAYRREIWSFVALCLVPDVVKWRFPNFNQARCLGGRRNCLQRLWLRAKAFDMGENSTVRWKMLEKLTEDAFVSIMERPSLSGNSDICKCIGLAWMKSSKKIESKNMEELNRQAIKKLRAKLTLINLDYLKFSALMELVESCYDFYLPEGTVSD